MNKQKKTPSIRKGEYQEIYQNRRWKDIVRRKQRNDPLCEHCMKLQPAIATAGKETHHRIPFQWGRTPEEIDQLAYDYFNAERLCVPHHKKADSQLQQMTVEERNTTLTIYFNHIKYNS